MSVSDPNLAAVLDRLWPAGIQPWMKICAVLDGARDERIFRAVEATPLEKCCLYAGRLPLVIQEAAPHLVVLQRDDKLTHFLIEKGWGQSWGIYLRTEATLPTLRRHLRGFLKVKDHLGRNLIFRWYDPRVMRVYLPTCLPDELRTVFGPIDNLYLEGATSAIFLEYRLQAGRLQQSAFPLHQPPISTTVL